MTKMHTVHEAYRKLSTGLLVAALCGFLSACVTSGGGSGERNLGPVRLMQTDAGVQISADDSVLFDTGSAVISKGGNQFLDKVADILTRRTAARVSIEGHTDSTGDRAYNMTLSEKRSLNVKQGLIKRKVAAERLTSKGYGPDRPVADNESDEGRQLNRRSEIIVEGETVDSIGGNATLDILTQALGNFIKDAGTAISTSVTGITRSIKEAVSEVKSNVKSNIKTKKK